MSTTRMSRYIEAIRGFAPRVVLFHDAIAQSFGINVTDLNAMRLLGESPKTPGQIAERTGLTGAAVTALVDRLVASGFVTRERDEIDRRRVTVRAVAAKIRKIDRAYEEYSEEIAKILAPYDAKEFDAIESFLLQATHLLTEYTAKLRKRAETVATTAARAGVGKKASAA